MMVKESITMNYKTLSLPLFALIVLLSACVGSKGYVGQYIQSDKIITIEKDTLQKGTWNTFDLIVNYEYEIDGDLLRVSGRGELGEHYKMNYDRVRYLWVYLFTLDRDGIINGSISLPVHMFRTEDRFEFERSVKLTDETRAISFGYDGFASEYDSRSPFYFP
jgi:hypothetical protein